MKDYISFMKAVCWTLPTALIIFALCSWHGYNKIIAERFRWECHWQEVKEDARLRRLAEMKAKEAAEAEKQEAMHAARLEQKNK